MSVPQVEVTKLGISPNNCSLDSELTLTVDFNLDNDIKDASWELTYIVDYASARHVLHLGASKDLSYSKGSSQFVIKAAKIDTGNLKRSSLLNVGLLKLVLKSGNEDVIEIKMVTQVSKAQDGSLTRTVFNPLE